jgi:TRAP transporter TAXI family solute receptor
MRRHPVRIPALIALFWLAACRAPVEKPEDVPLIRMATVLGRVMNPLAEALTKVLPDHFPARIEVVRAGGTGNTARLIEEGKAEFVMVQTDLAFIAYNRGTPDLPQPYRKLRAVAVLYPSPLHFLATRSSVIRTLADLRGKRVSIGLEGSSTEFTVKSSLEGVGLAPSDFQALHLADDALKTAVKAGQVDAVLTRGNDPAPLIQELMHIPGVRLVPISRREVEQIRSRRPFMHSAVIAGGVYGDHPEIETVAVDTLMACRDDLPDDLVYWITRTLFESLPDLVRSLDSMRQIDLDHVQASPIPLHPGAARFYRERELFQ